MDSIWGTPQRRRSLTAGDKKILLLKAKGNCEYCGDDIVKAGMSEEIHHIKKISEGGSDRPNNLIVLCPGCHSKVHHGTASVAILKAKIAYRLPKPKNDKASVKPVTKPKAKPIAKTKAAVKPKAKPIKAKTAVKKAKTKGRVKKPKNGSFYTLGDLL